MCQECVDLFGVTSTCLTPTSRDELLDRTSSVEWSLVELAVRAVAIAYQLPFTEEQIRHATFDLVDNQADDAPPIWEMDPQQFVSRIRLNGQLAATTTEGE